jgi:hypothetical protein
VDLVMWELFPDQGVAIEEIEIVRASRSPTVLSRADFQKVTGEADFPEFLARLVRSSQLLYYCNTTVLYRLRGINVWLNVAWGFEAKPGLGDRHLARFQGTKSSIEVRQGEPERFVPEVYVVPRSDRAAVRAALEARVAELQPRYPGVGVEDAGTGFRLTIPAVLRVGHEAHFAEVTRRFLTYLDDPASVPAWEAVNMRAKYHVTTYGVRLARDSG